MRKYFILGFLLIFLVGIAGVGYKLNQKQALTWLPGYFEYLIHREEIPPNHGPVHVLFMFVDHFEPLAGFVEPAVEIKRVDDWLAQYRELTARHRDADGVRPQHGWFYPYDQIHLENLKKISGACFDGLGEIELHLHHSNDTAESLTEKLTDALAQFGQVGALVTAEAQPRHAYAFIHGNWALDNSRVEGGRNYCGVNNELEVLARTGCFGDFTFPAFSGKAQPKKINSIYYAVENPAAPKSYNSGIDLKVGRAAENGFLIFEGPLVFDWSDGRHFWYPVLENGEIEHYFLPEPRRADLWVQTHIHVRGRPEWVFIKIFTHSARSESREIVCGREMDALYSYLEQKYNDGVQYTLHYITAREGYNIAKAAEAGKTGNPNQYRDFLIKPYANRFIFCNAFYHLGAFCPEKVELQILEHGKSPVRLFLKHPFLKQLDGNFTALRFSEVAAQSQLLISGSGKIRCEIQSPRELLKISGARILNCQKQGEVFSCHFEVEIGVSGTQLITW
jgi:hypothetical protein